jgi:predicted NAD/FAD-binding protein
MTSPLQQRLKVAGPVVVTANRVGDGSVVYRTRDGQWTTRLDQAAVATAASAASELLAVAAADESVAVGAYIAPVVLGPDGAVQPANLRERIRLGGPTIALPIAPELH